MPQRKGGESSLLNVPCILMALLLDSLCEPGLTLSTIWLNKYKLFKPFPHIWRIDWFDSENVKLCFILYASIDTIKMTNNGVFIWSDVQFFINIVEWMSYNIVVVKSHLLLVTPLFMKIVFSNSTPLWNSHATNLFKRIWSYYFFPSAQIISNLGSFRICNKNVLLSYLFLIVLRHKISIEKSQTL